MLISITPEIKSSPELRLLVELGVSGADSKVKQCVEGIYEIDHFGSSHWPNNAEWDHYPNLQFGDEYFNSYGVCDSYQDIIDKIKVLNDPDRQFFVTITLIEKDPDNYGQGGGWRWHKWGPYIGSGTPTTEYLDDEPLIDQVYVYHIYEKYQLPKDGQTFENIVYSAFNTVRRGIPQLYYYSNPYRLQEPSVNSFKGLLEKYGIENLIARDALPIASGEYEVDLRFKLNPEKGIGFEIETVKFHRIDKMRN